MPPKITIILWRLNSPSIIFVKPKCTIVLWKEWMSFITINNRTIRSNTAMPIPQRLTSVCLSAGALLDSIEIYNRLSNPKTVWSKVSSARVNKFSKLMEISPIIRIKFTSSQLFYKEVRLTYLIWHASPNNYLDNVWLTYINNY